MFSRKTVTIAFLHLDKNVSFIKSSSNSSQHFRAVVVLNGKISEFLP